jgi:2'-5' RNA ligase
MPRRRTALIVAVPEAEPHVSALREQHDSSAPLDVPAHITILYPFAPPEAVDEEALASVIASHAAFAFELATVEHFGDDVTYLAPLPAEPFSQLTRAVVARWPEYPPYEGAHDDPTPHLTVGECRLELEPPLPLACQAHEVLLIEEEEPGGRFRVRRRLPLG